jgi:DNA-binding SARP family transcriptional activator
VRVRVLGRLVVTAGDGRALTADDLPRRARQVLSVLAARYDRLQSKDALADAVWGDDLPANHGAALEHYVSSLRRRLQPGVATADSFIVTRAGGYLFATERAELDLAELRALVRLADGHPPGAPDRLALRQRVLDLAVEAPFAEDADADWAAAARTEVRDAVLAALLEVATRALAEDPERALRLAREALDLDGYLEQSYQLAMRASVALGRTDDALRWYERCRQTLDAELGLYPSSETEQLHREVLSGRSGQRPPASPQRALTLVREQRRPPPPATAVPFVGRARDLDLLGGARAVSLVHVVGPLGAGKSALLAELARRAPGRVGVGSGLGSAGALRLAWLRSALVDLGVDGAALAVVDDALSGRRPLAHDDLASIAARLDRPVVVAIDDAGRLDDDSVTELAWLRRHCPGLAVVLSYRYPSELAGRPAAALEADLVLRLAPLTPAELAAAGRPDLVEPTGGIPTLVAAASQGPEEDALAVAMHVARVRTRWMPPAAWDVLRVVATLGTLRVDQLAALTGLPLPDVLACVDQLVHAHLVVEGADGHVRHRSALVRAAVAEQVSSAHTTHLRRRLASTA